MHIFVGSTNPVKINATIVAAAETWPELEISGFEVVSGVSEQPTTDKETKTGAVNRAQAVLQLGLKKVTDPKNVLGVGLEGGVFVDDQNQTWTTVWAAVVDHENNLYVANGARFPVPEVVAKQIKAGEEMGPIMSSFFNGRSVKRQEGMIGVVTNNFVDRTEEYSAIIKMALGLWYGRDWQNALNI